MTLADLALNTPATVSHISGPRPFVQRLLSLGLAPGKSLRVLRLAPLGDPLQVEVGQLQLSIRRNEAGQVQLQPLSTQ